MNISECKEIINCIHTVKEIGSKTESHSFRVSLLAKEFGQYLKLNETDIRRLTIGGYLHDIGKISFSKTLLSGDDISTESDMKLIKDHTIKGIMLISNEISDQGIKDIILYHHERYDGLGYPFQLSGKDIPYLARVLSLCDSFDAMTSKRIYKPSLTLEGAIKEIKKHSGKQFDPILAYKFIDFIQLKKF